MRAFRFLPFVAASAAMFVCAPGCSQNNAQTATESEFDPGATHKTPQLNAATFYAHGHLLERQGNFKAAVEQYRRALKATPEYVAARNRLGITLNKLGKHDEATRELRKAVALQPGQSHLRNNLGFSLYLEGRHGEAAAALERALEINPEFRRALVNYGLVLAKLERFEEAFAAFQKAASEADAHYNMAMVYADAGRYSDATQSLEMALERNPRFEAAKKQLLQFAEYVRADEPATPPLANQPMSVRTAGAYPHEQPADEPITPINTEEMLSQPATEADPQEDGAGDAPEVPEQTAEDLLGLCDDDPTLRFALLFDAVGSRSPEAWELAWHQFERDLAAAPAKAE